MGLRPLLFVLETMVSIANFLWTTVDHHVKFPITSENSYERRTRRDDVDVARSGGVCGRGAALWKN
jgi:hypothetical protein